MTDSESCRLSLNTKIEMNDETNIAVRHLDLWPEKGEGEPEHEIIEEEIVGEYSAHQDQGSASQMSSKTIHTWNEEQTHVMLALYTDKLRNTGQRRRYKSKREIYESVSEDMNTQLGVSFSATQVENRLKSLSRKSKLRPNNYRPINRTPFAEAMAEIAKLDSSYEPDVMMTPTVYKRKFSPALKVLSNKKVKPSDDAGTWADHSDETPATSDLSASLVVAYRRETERKARRDREKAAQHHEKMEKFDQLLNILAEISEKMDK
ncbi:uncharacterized protein LOC129728909 [Wyeomyia smithii]|uniref:uncharacterized protein LOC129728909 n=1 Tax=Wyeomyia smithii TaxID=174621 RepID=UPI002468090D|nr:uncharacterized protein LOC129728909 [Wyeomyia smithii]XP_055543367.1 uncharacterized protein LOC129728909 [Wyeomyia smithii]XP_055543373.1 uncharacterized protein LOC129728909 [Wyeomyia smithii]XP_055543381.1 uncharacterized protein LOC129728909 [Wyeomyia smithii]XP_055543385.1 uncharacterized protein LOC129728909 [Wyeomyia smithii]